MPRLLLPSALLLCLLVLAPCLSFRAEAQTIPLPAASNQPGALDRKVLEEQVFSLINAYRTAHQLQPFAWNDAISEVARGHSKDMASGEVDFGHDGFTDRVSRLKTELTGLHGAGENVLRTDDPQQVASRAVDVWLHSPHHLANIRGDFNYSGMGIWVDDKGMIYFTQVFVKLQPPAPPSQTASVTTEMVTPLGMLAKPTSR